MKITMSTIIIIIIMIFTSVIAAPCHHQQSTDSGVRLWAVAAGTNAAPFCRSWVLGFAV